MESNSSNYESLEAKTHIAKQHIEKISSYSKTNNVLLAIRDLNPAIPDKIQEIGQDQYVGKDLHVKFKSSIIPELGGYIPVENRFSKKYDETADKKMNALLSEENSNYKAVNVTKVVNEKNHDTNYTLCYDKNNQSNLFYYRNEENGKYYSDIRNGAEVDSNNMNFAEVKVLGDKQNRILIPDYDLAIIGEQAEKIQTFAELHEDYGRVPLTHKGVIEDLQGDITDNMVRHGSDNYNPVSYKFEMSNESPYTCFLPNGDISVANNPQEYLDVVNKWRDPERNPMKQSYDLVLNPRLGVEVNKNGDLYLPEEGARFNWEKLDGKINEMSNQVKNFDKSSPEYKNLNEKLELNKLIVNQYEKI